MNVQSNNCNSYEYKLGDNSAFDTIVRLIIEIIDSDVMSNEFELH